MELWLESVKARTKEDAESEGEVAMIRTLTDRFKVGLNEHISHEPKSSTSLSHHIRQFKLK